MSEEPMEPEHQMVLVMPFVCCKGNGGSLDDDAFAAGATFGAMMTKLLLLPDQVSEYVQPEMVAQYDLLAMDRGYFLTAEPWDEHPDEWVLITLSRAAPAIKDEEES